MLYLRFLALVVLLNIVRYAGGWVFEPHIIFPGLFGAMSAEPEYFRTAFEPLDWVTSYFYNFVMWLVAALVFHLLRPVLSGSDLVASLKSYGIMWLNFAAVSAIYMNHYSHSRTFYFWNILDGLLVFTLVAVATALLYRPLMGPWAKNPAMAGDVT